MTGTMVPRLTVQWLGQWESENNETPRPTVSDSNNCTACRSINQIRSHNQTILHNHKWLQKTLSDNQVRIFGDNRSKECDVRMRDFNLLQKEGNTTIAYEWYVCILLHIVSHTKTIYRSSPDTKCVMEILGQMIWRAIQITVYEDKRANACGETGRETTITIKHVW